MKSSMTCRNLLLFALVVLLSSCSLFHQRQHDDVVVSVNGHYLTSSELAAITRSASMPEDSALLADRYIRQWASAILFYDKATAYQDSTIEGLVDDYRRSLYVNAYEQKLVTSRMSHYVADTTIAQFYEEHREQFLLHENLVKGVLLIIPNDAPKQDKLRKWLATLNEDNIEKIEKYAYQYASGYELFLDGFKPANQIVLRMPLDADVVQSELRDKELISISDSVNTYFLQVVDKRLIGEFMPLEYAHDAIRDILLSYRQVEFLHEQRDALYEDAVRFNRVKFYDN